MKQKKPSSLTRILGYAGGHKNLTILGCVLSALSAVLGLAPYLCVWLVARSILAAWPSLDGAGDLGPLFFMWSRSKLPWSTASTFSVKSLWAPMWLSARKLKRLLRPIRNWCSNWASCAGLTDRKSTRLNSSHSDRSRMPSSA